jgi:hypothetical protein
MALYRSEPPQEYEQQQQQHAGVDSTTWFLNITFVWQFAEEVLPADSLTHLLCCCHLCCCCCSPPLNASIRSALQQFQQQPLQSNGRRSFTDLQAHQLRTFQRGHLPKTCDLISGNVPSNAADARLRWEYLMVRSFHCSVRSLTMMEDADMGQSLTSHAVGSATQGLHACKLLACATFI